MVAGQELSFGLLCRASRSHGWQRFLPLTLTQNTGSLSVTAPANAKLAPPGDYMLFLGGHEWRPIGCQYGAFLDREGLGKRFEFMGSKPLGKRLLGVYDYFGNACTI